MTLKSYRIAVIGAGGMGLAVAFHLLKRGYHVTIYEADSVPGGMAAHLDFDGLNIERFYHFVCRADQPLFELLNDLDLTTAMRWQNTSMGYYYHGRLYGWGDPVSLLRFPQLSLLDKARYAMHVFSSVRRSRWDDLDSLTAESWIKSWLGENAYNTLWKPLLSQKFFHYAPDISAAWIWTRIKRIGTSRKSIFQEQLGYIDGGSETLVNALVDNILAMQGTLHLNQPVHQISVSSENKVEGVYTTEGFQAFDRVISTVPLPYVSSMLPPAAGDLRKRYQDIPNIGVVCTLHKLRKSISKNFWLNISDPRFEIPGLIEFSRLRNFGDEHIVYLPYYLPVDHPKFQRTDDEFISESHGYLRMLAPELEDQDIISTRVGRLRHAQPICSPQFLKSLPPIQSDIEGLFIADTCHYYPEDRGLSESVRLGKKIADLVEAGS